MSLSSPHSLKVTGLQGFRSNQLWSLDSHSNVVLANLSKHRHPGFPSFPCSTQTWVCVGSYSFSHSWWLSISHGAYDCSNKTHEFWSLEDLRDELIWGFVSSSKQWTRANEMAPMLKMLTVKADHPSPTSKPHMVGENWQDVHTHMLCVCYHTPPHHGDTQNKQILLKNVSQVGDYDYICNPNTQEAEAGGYLWILGQPELQNGAMSQ